MKKILYIDAMALVQDKKSGVGVTLENTLNELLKLDALEDWKVNLVVTLGKAKFLKKYRSSKVQVKTIYLPARILEVLLRSKLLLPIDWFLGTGVYVFPNYRNWPVWHSRSITYVYDLAYAKFPKTVQIKNQKYLNKYMPSWIRRTDRVITISNQVKYEIEKQLGLGESQIDVVPCGVDRSVFYKRDDGEIKKVKKFYNIEFDKYFLFVGNIEPRKNLVKLLDAYNLLDTSTKKKYGLVFVGGDGWQNEDFSQKLNKLQTKGMNILKVTEYVKSADLPALYSGATMLIHPAIYEGFGITPLEAMACGTPVAVSNIPAIREVVKDAGLYFNPDDSRDIASVIKAILTQTDLVSSNVALGLELASELSWGNTAQEFIRVIGYEQKQDIRKHPLLARSIFIAQSIDRKILYLLGEKVHLPYVPAYSKTGLQMKKYILNDFINEQPTMYQLFIKRIYLKVKHRTSWALRSIYSIVRKKSE